MSTITSEHDLVPPPWYRQFWPWALIAIPGVSVLLGILMITLATSGHDALVVDDWYKEGKAINQRIERDAAAARLGLAARLDRVPEGLLLELSSVEPAFVVPPTLDVRWVHVTRADRDGGATFSHVGRGRYVAADAVLPEEGRWRLHVEPDGVGASAASLPAWRLISAVITLERGSSPRLSADRAGGRDLPRRPPDRASGGDDDDRAER